MKIFLLLGLISVWISTGLAPGTEVQENIMPESGERILLQNIRIFDVFQGKMSQPQNILLEGDRIKAVGTDVTSSRMDIRKIDCEGKFAVPGLFECHTHLTFLRTMGKTTLKTILSRFVQNGITQVRDVGGPIDVLHEISQAVSKGEMLGPEFFYTGPMLEKPPLHWEEHNKRLPGFTVAVDTREDVDRILPELVEGGAQLVKTFNKFDKQIYAYLLEKARAHSLRVIHDPGMPFFQMIPMEQAIDMGVTSIEHAMAPWHLALKDEYQEEYETLLAQGADEDKQNAFRQKMGLLGANSVSPENLERIADTMLAKKVYLCPTLYVMEFLARQPSPKDKSKEEQEQQKKFLAGMIEVGCLLVRELAQRNVKLLVGQDNINPMGTLVEMRLLNKCGVDEPEIIRGATLYPALWLGVED
ncbi:MAG: amidohydrolase family protein, partial [Candidatus Aminicenantes bacterium]|nr:amidohydrolase family protein [Candidatus Aminicenantes bacterium]